MKKKTVIMMDRVIMNRKIIKLDLTINMLIRRMKNICIKKFILRILNKENHKKSTLINIKGNINIKSTLIKVNIKEDNIKENNIKEGNIKVNNIKEDNIEEDNIQISILAHIKDNFKMNILMIISRKKMKKR